MAQTEDSTRLALRGHVIQFSGNPFCEKPESAITDWSDGLVVIENGVITQVGNAQDLLPTLPEGTQVDHHKDRFILPGFVDCHVHYPQIEVIASYGTQLLEWLNKYTFPAESKFFDEDYARRAAQIYFKENLKNGITSASVYCTIHPESVNALFETAETYNARMVAGKVMMDRHAPDTLLDTAQTGYDQSKALIEKWHGKGRAVYSITPRFAPTSTPAQLEAAGALWKEHPTVRLQTHTSENKKELLWVKELFPEHPDYVGVYEHYGLLGKGAVLGHGIYMNEREVATIHETGTAIAHCPTSNTFVGSGLFNVKASQFGTKPFTVGLATDTGGGSTFSMLQTMRCAYEVAHLQGIVLHPAQAYYMATVGSAQSLCLEDKIGNIKPGMEADITVIDPVSTPLIANRMSYATELTEALFIQMILGDDRAIAATYIGGKQVYNKDEA
ncbi:guanine deaminase [Rhodobacteraceae bacterium RKSG542]|uniref:guanine deaminase n=1 Tax=Pseudovibrio flavus TaxID=2529854 RepID=UPI0012BC0C17|nr:guanine deaminase [Pseudovibrio flavus]MTI17707.1 guanine deaminase [Pseudovibrio flavus]